MAKLYYLYFESNRMILSLHVPRYRSYSYEYNEIGVIVQYNEIGYQA
jgi:hypothetical protein